MGNIQLKFLGIIALKLTFYRLLPRVERMAPRNRLRLKGKFLALDSTTIELCLALSEWAQFHHGKGAVKLHVALDLAGNLPTVIVKQHVA